ncbi:tol-pal system protein YbgF [Chiayiivirga flava]|uniref:Cell division coordinator CpoB n=1 Tax=Chiayiivirga flava TaxID=659595 RepID=A0A7W8G0H1_9GAMM|nr:tol-pal system protein YbgF [Chiayiivirga flava]
MLAAASSMAQAQEGRLSLSERMARLEQQANSGQQTVELLNRITELQAEVQSLRGQIEEQSFKIQELEKRNRDQYVDLDSRIARIESGQAGTGQPLLDPAAVPPAPGADGSPAAPNQIVMEAPDVRPPVDAGLESVPADGSTEFAPTETIVDPAAERAAYESAFDSLKNGQYAEAARRFQGFLQQYPSGDYSPNAQYWLGESYYVTQNYQIALDAFQRLLSQFPSSNKAPDALLKVGYCHYELKQWTQAEATLNQVVQQYPDTTVARLAQGRLRALRLENRQ